MIFKKLIQYFIRHVQNAIPWRRPSQAEPIWICSWGYPRDMEKGPNEKDLAFKPVKRLKSTKGGSAMCWQSRFITGLTVIMAVGLVAAAGLGSAAEQREFRAVLTSYHHAVPIEAPARGEVIFRLSEDTFELRYKLMVNNAENVIMAHVHLGSWEHIETPVVWLYPSSPPPKLMPGRFDGVLAEGTITAASLRGQLRGKPLADLMEEIYAGNAYVNLHTRHHHFELRGYIR
jgi:hypothetical protein